MFFEMHAFEPNQILPNLFNFFQILSNLFKLYPNWPTFCLNWSKKIC